MINGTDSGLTATTDSSGNYSISASPSAGNILLVYLDNETEDGTTVAVSNGGTLSSLDIYQNHVVIGGTLSNVNMETATNGDSDIQYTSSSGTLTANGIGVELYIPSGHSFTPGGTVNLMHLENVGTITAGANTFVLLGNWLGSGTFNADTSIVLIAGSSNQTITSGGNAFNKVTILNALSSIIIADTFDVNDAFVHNAGILDLSTNNPTVNTSGSVTLAGSSTTINISGRTANWTFDGTTAFSDLSSGGPQSLGNVVVNGTSLSLSNSMKVSDMTLSVGTINAGSGTLEVTGNFLESSGTFNADSASITALANWTYSAGTFNRGTSTLTFSSNGTNTITGSHILNNVSFAGPGGGWSSNFTIASGTTLTIIGTMIVGDAVNNPPIILNTGNIDAQGDITVNTTNTSGGGTATLTINGGGAQTLTGSGTIRSGFIPKVVIDKTTGTLNLASIISTGDDWTYSVGSTAAGSSTLVFDSGGTQTITGSHTLANLIFTGPGGGWDPAYTIASGTTLTLTGDLEIANAGGSEGAVDVNTGTIDVQGNMTVGATAAGGTASIIFSGTKNQIFTSSGDAPDGTYTLNKTLGSLTLVSAMNLNGSGQDLTLTQGTLDLAGFALTVNDVLTVGASGILQLEGGQTITTTTTTLNAGSQVIYDGGGTYTGLAVGDVYSNLTFDNAGGTWRLGNVLDVNGNLTITNGTLDVSATDFQINVAGNWSNSGTLTARSGTVVFDGTNQTISGSTTFNSFSKTESINDATDVTLTFGNAGTQTISGLLTLDCQAPQIRTKDK